VAQGLAVLDEGVYVVEGYFRQRLAEPGEEQAQVAGIVDGRAGVRRFAAQPFLEPLDFWYCPSFTLMRL